MMKEKVSSYVGKVLQSDKKPEEEQFEE